jgi:hypothetical protein
VKGRALASEGKDSRVNVVKETGPQQVSTYPARSCEGVKGFRSKQSEGIMNKVQAGEGMTARSHCGEL